MVITGKELIPVCDCGRRHELQTEKIIIEHDAGLALEDEIRKCGLPERYAVIYDENTYAALDGKRPAAAREVILPPENLHADEHGVDAALERLGDEPMLVAAGSGTVHDITRYVASQRGLPFVSMPTAASVDGFAAAVAAMTLGGFKVTVPAVPPRIILADTEVISKAPRRLTASGFGDVLGKYVSLTDWAISRALTGEYYCSGIAELTKEAAEEAASASVGIASGDTEAYAKLIKALVLSGVAMQLSGNSRPASGAEHHISHLMEIGVPWLPKVEALHGEKVGVGTLLSLRAYARWRTQNSDAVAHAVSAWEAPDAAVIRNEFGPLADAVMKENEQNCLSAVSSSSVKKNWGTVKELLQRLPSADEIEKMLLRVGAKTKLEELGVNPDLEGRILRWSPYVRNRLTFMRLMGAQSAVSRICCP